MNKSLAISVQQISFTDEEFALACDKLAWKNPEFCMSHVQHELEASTKRSGQYPVAQTKAA